MAKKRSRSKPARVPEDASPLTSSPFAVLQGVKGKALSPKDASKAVKEPPKPGREKKKDVAKISTEAPSKEGGGVKSSSPAQSSQTEAAPPPFRVQRSKKGGWRITVSRRSGGRFITTLEGVEGDARALLSELKRILGSGGRVLEKSLELQGDCKARLISLLDEMKRKKML